MDRKFIDRGGGVENQLQKNGIFTFFHYELSICWIQVNTIVYTFYMYHINNEVLVWKMIKLLIL